MDCAIELENELALLSTIHFNRPKEEKGLLCQRWRNSLSRSIFKWTDISVVELPDLLLTVVNFRVISSSCLTTQKADSKNRKLASVERLFLYFRGWGMGKDQSNLLW